MELMQLDDDADPSVEVLDGRGAHDVGGVVLVRVRAHPVRQDETRLRVPQLKPTSPSCQLIGSEQPSLRR